MSCSSCSKSFSLFTREHGCPGCGFSMCSGCLKHSLVVKNKPQKVCSGCVAKSKQPNTVRAPPEALQKRMEKTPMPKILSQPPGQQQKSAATSEDEKIAARLRALQQERSRAAPSTEQVRARLDQLRDKPSPSLAPAPVYRAPDTRSSVERSSELLGAVTAEVELESRLPILSPDQEIERRLARLRGETPPAPTSAPPRDNTPDPAQFLASNTSDNNNDYKDIDKLDMDEVHKLMQEVDKKMRDEAAEAIKDLEKDRAIQDQLQKLKVRKSSRESPKAQSDSEDEEEEEGSDRMLTRILAEARLEDRLSPLAPRDRGRPGPGPAPPEPEPEELPWCVICNEDARLRCLDCGGDLYCGACWRELHSDREDRGHRTQTYKRG